MDREQLASLLPHRHLTLRDLDERKGQVDTTAIRAVIVKSYVASAFSESKVLQDAMRDMPPPSSEKADWTTAIRERLHKAGVPADQLDAMVETIDTSLRAVAADVEDVPLENIPAVAPLVEKARLHEVASLAGAGHGWVDAATAHASAVGGLDEAGVARLVSENIVDEDSARRIGLAAAVYELADNTLEIARAVLNACPISLDGKPPASTSDLARVSADEWEAALTTAKVAPPDGASIKDLAAGLAGRFSELHPGVALLGRLPTVQPGKVLQGIERLGPLIDRNPKVFTVDFDKLDTSGLESARIAQLEAAHRELRQTVIAFPGLGLAEVLDDPHLSAEAKSTLVARRIGLVKQVTERVGADRLLQLDFGPRSADHAELGLAPLGAVKEDQRRVISTLKAFQRASAAADDAGDAQRLVRAELSSSRAIAALDFEAFRAKTGLDEVRARRYYNRARDFFGDTAVTVGAIVDTWWGKFHGFSVDNVLPDARDYLRELDGFDDLFGQLSFCNCTACQSILSPAAYLVDLMKFVDERIRNQFTGRPNHPLDLRTRRPDLWTLELTCANTNDRIAMLEIVDEILEQYIAKARGYGGTVADRKRLVYQMLADAGSSFGQPFHLPIATLDELLGALGSSRAEIARTLGASDAVWTQAKLGVGPREWELITAADRDLGRLQTRYGIDFHVAGAGLDPVPAERLLQGMNLTRAQMGALVNTGLVRAGGAAPQIRAEKRSVDSVQNDVENVHGLTVDALDRMHRLTRLWRRLPWDFEQLDRVLIALAAADLTPHTVVRVAQVRALEEQLQLKTDDVCALVGPLPRTPAGKSLFDKTFNPPEAVAAGLPYPQNGTRFVHPALRAGEAPVDRNVARLLSALGLDIADLERLIRALAQQLGFQIADPDESKRGFFLTEPNLTLLYRYARLAKAFKMRVAELLQLIDLAGVATPVDSGADVVQALEFLTWQKASGYRLDDLAIATGRTPLEPARYPDPVAVIAEVMAGARDALTFEATVFAVALAMTENGSCDLVEAMATAGTLTADADRWRIASGIDVATMAIAIPATALVPDGAGGTRVATVAEVRGTLAGYAARDVVARRLGAAFRFAADKIDALAGFVGVDLAAPNVVQALLGGAPAPLEALVRALIPVGVAFHGDVWDAAAIDHVRGRPAAYDVAAPPMLTMGSLRALSTYARLALRRHGEPLDDVATAPADLRAVIEAFVAPPDAAAGFAPAVDDAMARVLANGKGLIVSLRGRIAVAPTALAHLERLDQAIALAARLGLDGEVLAAAVEPAITSLERAADAVYGAARARHPDEVERAKEIDRLERPLRERRRDALADYVVRTLHPDVFDQVRELSPYFLIDIEAGGCQDTSRVIAATNSVQLYVQRVIMNLEQDRRDADDPLHLELHLSEEAVDEWSWRKNYRVWEANRKVFLWPENYIEPDLRDDKTPLFEELESELLQTPVSKQNVLDAYGKYLKGFEELAGLTIAGAYHDIVPIDEEGDTDAPEDVLHLFGVSNTDPPTFYYRTCEDLRASGRDPAKTATWTPWRKVDVQITGRRVAPVVQDGRLHVFWTDYKTRPYNQISNGGSHFAGYTHTMRLRFTTLQLDGRWTAPQEIELPSSGPRVYTKVDTGLPRHFPFPPIVLAQMPAFGPGRGAIQDPLIMGHPRLDDRPQTEPIDDYTLAGPNWDWCWPIAAPGATQVLLEYRNFALTQSVDLFRRTITGIAPPPPANYRPQLLATRGTTIYSGVPGKWISGPNGTPNLVIDEQRLDVYEREQPGSKAQFIVGLYARPVARIFRKDELLAIPGNTEDAIIQVGNDVLLLQGSVTQDTRYVLRRIGTTLVSRLARRLFTRGIDDLLSLDTQLSVRELAVPLTTLDGQIIDRSNAGLLDFKGPYGTYYREIFFHIPFLIANHLNSQGRFADAQHWYHFLFDPTATEIITVPPGTPPEQRARRLRDRVWRYLEFRDRAADNLRDVLTDPEALKKYRRDPFNPHAIARLRLSAYQKAVVMKYVDNLIDWGDHLFTKFERESINEALLLYMVAADILGPRPAELGECGEGGIEPRDYENIAPAVQGTDDLLVEVESWILGRTWAEKRPDPIPKDKVSVIGLDRPRITQAIAKRPLVAAAASRLDRPGGGDPAERSSHMAVETLAVRESGSSPAAGRGGGVAVAEAAAFVTPRVAEARAIAVPPGNANGDLSGTFRATWSDVGPQVWTPALGAGTTHGGALAGERSDAVPRARVTRSADLEPSGRGFARTHERPRVRSKIRRRFGWELIRQLNLVFCIPPNRDLLDYWDRIEDRLYKIRHCMDINGVVRELSLLAPEIDPRLLVRARAEGLTLDDILGAGNGSLPPYRFLFLIDRAKTFAATLQGFGSALLGALERRDGEEMTRLRTVHQKNLSELTTRLHEWEVNIAEETLEAVNRQREAAQFRQEFYQGLLDRDRNGWEIAESVARHVAAGIRVTQGTIGFLSAIFTLVPQIGSPFAMKYGGVEIGGSLDRFFHATGTLAVIADAVASSANLEAGYDRRREGWTNQRDLATKDIAVLQKQVKTADYRIKIANRALEIHKRSIEQIDEVLELIDSKFTNLGLYTWLAQQLQRTYRDAYNNAHSLARLAEQAYRFERNDEAGPGLSSSYWDPGRAGLLAGERLLIDLQNLERRFLETNYRTHEVDQAFSMAQIDPAALTTLRETGTCEFSIPEFYFDLYYPGHYRRRIRGVRLTIPCITGPYVNVAATLELLSSQIRMSPDGDLVDVPPRRTTSIATSTAQNDAGVFELSFRDERYMPFEGAGAVSTWRVTLPKAFRSFDYHSINDVILSISYAAEMDGALRGRVEVGAQGVESLLLRYIADNPMRRVFSLRQDFSSAFTRLVRSPGGTEVRFEINDRHFPVFAQGKVMVVTQSLALIRITDGASLGAFSLLIDGTAVAGWAPRDALGGLVGASLPAAFNGEIRPRTHSLAIANAGDLAPPAGNASALDPDKVQDILLFIEYTLS